MYMLKTKDIPTPLVPDEERAPVPIIPFKRQRRRGLHIVYQLLLWAVNMLRIRLTTPDEEERGHALGIATREMMESIGYLWVKVGQLIALRDDLISKEFCAELAKLQFQATGFPVELARAAIERELGGPVEHFFDDFQDAPMAAASIAQVHRARLKDGTEVVVKVMRPHSDEIFLDDMAFFGKIVRFLSRFDSMEFLRLEEAVWELDQMMREEVDFRYELSNLKRMRKQLRRHKVYIPKPYRRYSTRRVIVMEYLPGTLMSDFIRLRNEDPGRVNAWAQENKVNIKKVGKKLFLSFLRQLLEENRFHGDLHPGNIMLLANNRIALIDLGTISSIERNLMLKYFYMMKAVAENEFEKAVDLLLSFPPELPVVDLQPVREDMVRAFRAWAIRTPIKSIPYYEKSLTEGIVEVTRIMSAKRIMVTWGFLRIDRTWGNLDSSMHYLDPQVNQTKLFRTYFSQRVDRLVRETTRPRTIRRAMAGIPDTVNEVSLFLTPQIRRASRMFSGYNSKLGDVAGAVFGIVTKVFIGGVLVMIPLYLQAYQPQILERVPRVQAFLHQLPAFLTVSQWMSQFPQIVWGFALLVDLYLLLTMRSVTKRMEDEEVRLPSNDRA